MDTSIMKANEIINMDLTNLYGGKTGFSKISKVVCRASSLIKKNGKLILEIGFDQKSKVIEILKKNRFYIDKIAKDYAKRDRCIIFW